MSNNNRISRGKSNTERLEWSKPKLMVLNHMYTEAKAPSAKERGKGQGPGLNQKGS